MQKYSLPEHKELFHQVSRGDENAFATLFHHYSRQLYPFVLKKVKSEIMAEEIVQEVFLKLWLNRQKMEGMENPEGYLYRMTANLVLDHFSLMAHEQSIRKYAGINPDQAIDTTTEEGLRFKEARNWLKMAIKQLPPQRKVIYELRQQGYSYEEIGSHLKLSVNTVKNQLISANRFIRDYLLSKGISPVLVLIWCFCA